MWELLFTRQRVAINLVTARKFEGASGSCKGAVNFTINSYLFHY